jgi:hypothetical protein
MYDSVYPTRTARFGVALTPQGTLKLRHAKMAQDFRPMDETCSCMVGGGALAGLGAWRGWRAGGRHQEPPMARLRTG